jgi:hypothetical protein
LLDEGSYERRFHERPGAERRGYWAVPFGDRLIWGATAGMLQALRARLMESSFDKLRMRGAA